MPVNEPITLPALPELTHMHQDFSFVALMMRPEVTRSDSSTKFASHAVKDNPYLQTSRKDAPY